ncbi:peptidase [Pikeienuella piscinae]|uniref:Peptidase n=1 Tax=Pikeienuella piscinae TaxID=2748098 RepID=A0A7L5C052_9RHOB|nr:peptidase [Pikeienuella piscinae]QIE56753.1 peptidase [Pikeienuella piscinae]
MNAQASLDKGLERSLTVALGDRRYRVERPFFANEGPGAVSDVAICADGTTLALIRTDPLVGPVGPAVFELNADGGIQASWGDDLILDAHMVAAAPDGRVFVVDRDAHEIVICKDRRRVGGIGTRHGPLQPFNHPTSVAFAPDGDIYVSDGYANHRVHRFAPDGRLIGSWGEAGDGPGAFMNPHSVWVRTDGNVVVVDRENDRLQLFTPDGELLDIWTGFVKPLDVWGDAEDNLYVTDFIPSLTMLSADGVRIGRCRPVLNGAHGITGDAEGNLFLAEPSPSRISKLARL